MKHSEYINTLTKRGEKAAYARKLNISRSFLSQIKNEKAKTPRNIYINVVKETQGKVSLEELVSE